MELTKVDVSKYLDKIKSMADSGEVDFNSVQKAMEQSMDVSSLPDPKFDEELPLPAELPDIDVESFLPDEGFFESILNVHSISFN